MKLSILICSIPTRMLLLHRLWSQLAPQLPKEGVEVLWIGDNKKRSIGDKRNDLLKLSRGEFITFIDDDDRITADYVSTILGALNESPKLDVLTFTQMVSINGGPAKPCYYGIELPYKDAPDKWTGKPAHTMVWRREIAVSESFTNKSQGEDTDWVALVSPKVKVQIRLDKVLYHYDYNVQISERP